MKNRIEICGMNTKDLKVLTEKEKMHLLSKFKNGDMKAREKLVEGNLRLVLSVVQKFSGRGEILDDLFQIGCIGLMKSIDNFDVSKNTRFSTYAVPMIIGEIKRYLRDNNSVRISRSLRDIAYKALQVKEKLIFENNKEPKISEISSELMIPEETIAIALESILEPISLQEPIFNDRNSTENLCVIDQIGDSNDDVSWSEELSIKQVMQDLNEREKKIIFLRFFKGFTQIEVAQNLSMSQAQISRLEKNAVKKIYKIKEAL
ncbi:MAG: RNA polymerase sporulation sigma factor SigG [Candidatus Improbicoccus pseudotrichonymphae]|uniref:RNA polymerase sigma factor n=1 Tax=Candidatus Improbicoccus pseudotrichonymphae TaxID=3033792 RepID=A0AA48HUX9_9FIRM|nr:MAG: RNA polymerase sporulation sigma factor SigG [Candidatus Improbicoccus pseudotrichonymphae]